MAPASWPRFPFRADWTQYIRRVNEVADPAQEQLRLFFVSRRRPRRGPDGPGHPIGGTVACTGCTCPGYVFARIVCQRFRGLIGPIRRGTRNLIRATVYRWRCCVARGPRRVVLRTRKRTRNVSQRKQALKKAMAACRALDRFLDGLLSDLLRQTSPPGQPSGPGRASARRVWRGSSS